MLLVIACGNALRQDDGAGLRLAEGLVAAWQKLALPVRLITVHQLLPELSLELVASDVTAVLFVDTRVARDEADTAIEYAPLKPTSHAPPLGHTMNPQLILYYASYLFGFSNRIPVFQLTIPGFHFNHDDSLSTTCNKIMMLCFQDASLILNKLNVTLSGSKC